MKDNGHYLSSTTPRQLSGIGTITDPESPFHRHFTDALGKQRGDRPLKVLAGNDRLGHQNG